MTAISHQDHDTKASGRLIILLAAIFLAPAVLAGFISQGLTVFLRMAGQPQEIVGLVFAAGIPFALSFLWAPLVDRYGFRRLGYRRGWLLVSLVGAIAASSIFLVLDPAEHPYALILTAAVMMGFLGTYIAAASGWMLDKLGTGQHAAGAAAQASSAAVGGLILGLGIFYLFGSARSYAARTCPAGLPATFSQLPPCPSRTVVGLCQPQSVQEPTGCIGVSVCPTHGHGDNASFRTTGHPAG